MRNLIVCCDGTWNRRDAASLTNVVKFHDGLVQDALQQAHYFAGVGTQGSWWERLLGGTMGHGLSERIKEAYRYLVENYQDGDRLCFIGFSRGAYTVRSLAGFIRKAGLVRREELSRLDEAYALYRNGAHPSDPEPTQFRERHSVEPVLHLIGIWDTVGALGIPTDWANWLRLNQRVQFHDVNLSSRVHFAYQALAIDERRKPFRPTLWQQQEAGIGRQTLEQAWFPGVHTNVGGGNALSGLSDQALLWMTLRAEQAGLRFKPMPALQPQYQEPIDNRLGFFYSLWSAIDRPIGKFSKEGLHEVVLQRHREDPHYRPPELEAYLQTSDRRIYRITTESR